MESTPSRIRRAYETASVLRFTPHILTYESHPARSTIDDDVKRWKTVWQLQLEGKAALNHILTWSPEFRSLFYFRLGPTGRALSLLAGGMPTLFIKTPRNAVGPGLFLQHAFATIISARSVGARCWINQQVTIGYTDETRCPTLEDDVSVGAGAIVLGDILVRRGTTIGAGSVVVKDTPAFSVVAGVPARVIGENYLHQ